MLNCNDWAHSHRYRSGIGAPARGCERFSLPTSRCNGAVRRGTVGKWCVGDVRAPGGRFASSQYHICSNGIDNAGSQLERSFAFIDEPQCSRCFDCTNIRVGIRTVSLLGPDGHVHQLSVVSGVDVHLAGVLHAVRR